MRKMILLAIGCFLLWQTVGFYAAVSQSTRRPNIVLIIADYPGWKDVGYQGTDFYETPNIDRLERQQTSQIHKRWVLFLILIQTSPNLLRSDTSLKTRK